MRAFCTVSAPLEVCAPPTRPLSPGARFLALRLLGPAQQRTLYFLVEAKSRVREVYAQTCLHFTKQGMQDTELFGLAVLIDGEFMFADPESKLSKYGPKSWRSSHTHGLDANGRPLLELHFRVQFYIESPFMLRDETSRHNYYLQLKHNAINSDIPKEYSEQSMILLGGLALQADLGDSPLLSAPINSKLEQSKRLSKMHPNEIDESSCDNSSEKIISSLRAAVSQKNTIGKSISDNSNVTSMQEKVMPSSSVSSLATSSVSVASSALTSSSNQSLDYFRLEDYLPVNIQSAWSVSALRSCHRENRGMSKADAELNYIRQACSLHEAINAHVYRMKMNKQENGIGSAWFVVYSKGIRVYSKENTQPITFLWPNITKLKFERKKFEIISGENKIILYSTSDEKNKMILTLCRETHQFNLKIANRLKEAIRKEEEENNCLDACYIYSRSLHLTYKNKNDQRISVISSTSSNTTSGIVSDRVHSEDELEIMINTPPSAPNAAPSTESLALAHLLDNRSSVSRQTSSAGQVSLKDLEDHLAALSIRSKTRTSSTGSKTEGDLANTCQQAEVSKRDESPQSDSPQHNIGSQCSSTCSTVVVAQDSGPLSSLKINPENRRNSTSSSLELGFSHTAQNSTLSEGASTCLGHEYHHNTDLDGEAESISGVYTLEHGAPPTETSGVYTMNSSEITGESSEIAESESHESLHYGCFQPGTSARVIDEDDAADSVDGGTKYNRNRMQNDDVIEFRLRSDSNLSTSSFRGDGSDPTDNKHTLLTVEELTDLIVGIGNYPTTKSTLDSDSDYMTIPLEGDNYVSNHDKIGLNTTEVDSVDALPKDALTGPKAIEKERCSTLPSLLDIRMRSPPPYNSRHEKTGLCGPPIPKRIPVVSNVSQSKTNSPEQPAIPIPLRDPPPYPQQPSTLIKQQQRNVLPKTPSKTLDNQSNENKAKTVAPTAEEATARFIKTRPQINILKAHTSVVNDSAKLNYGAPTITSMQMAAPIQPRNRSLIQKRKPQAAAPIQQNNNKVGIPYGMSAIPSTSPYHHEVKPPRTCVLLPVIKPRQYLPPPPPTLPRQPPPPPPPSTHQFANVYASQLAHSQIELYQKQLYSDVDYVIYPIQDPAVSQQEYLDAKQTSLLAAIAQSPPPPPYLAFHNPGHHHPSTWGTYKGHAICRSTSYLPMALSTHSRYASTQNLSDTYVQLPSAYSPLYSPSMASLCSSYEPPPPPPFQSSTIHAANNHQQLFHRSRSDDNILNSIEGLPKMKRLPPPPPPAYRNSTLKKPFMPAPLEVPPPIPVKPLSHQRNSLLLEQSLKNNSCTTNSYRNSIIAAHTIESFKKKIDMDISSQSIQKEQSLKKIDAPTKMNSNSLNNKLSQSPGNTSITSIDIQTLREKSRNMDLPLISALCNDRSLIKQTKAFVVPKHSSKNSTGSSTSSNPTLTRNQLSKHKKASTISHRHPNDKLPPLPIPQASANNYVLDPTPAKHKSYNSQLSTNIT